jgi:hypothetical protein
VVCDRRGAFGMHLLSLRVRVAVLVLVGVLPLLCFNLGNIYFNYRADRAQAEHNTLDVARRIALAIEGELRLRVAILEVLALSSLWPKAIWTHSASRQTQSERTDGRGPISCWCARTGSN